LNCFPSPYIFFGKKEKGKKESRKTVGAAQLSRLLKKILPGCGGKSGNKVEVEFSGKRMLSKKKIGWRFFFKTRRAWPLQLFF